MSETAQSQKAKPAEQKQAKPAAQEKKPAAQKQAQAAKPTSAKTAAAEKPKAEAAETEEQKAAGGFRQKVEKAIGRKEEAKEKEPPVLETRIYTIPLREVKNTSRLKRAKRAVSYVQDFIKKHMKTDDVKMSAELNEILWSRGIRYVPSSIKVQALKTEKYVALKPSE